MDTRRTFSFVWLVAACLVVFSASTLVGCGGADDGGSGSLPGSSNGDPGSSSGGESVASRSGGDESAPSESSSSSGGPDDGAAHDRGGSSGGTTGGGSGTTSGGSDGTSSGGTTSGSSSGGTTTGESRARDGKGSSGSTGSSGSSSGSSSGTPKPEAGQLTAGEWNDLEHWSFWLGLFDDPANSQTQQRDFTQHEQKWGIHTRDRVPVRVVTPNDEPVVNARIELLDSQDQTIWMARTDNRGRAELYAGFEGQNPSGPFSIEASSAGATATASDVTPMSAGDARAVLTLQQAQSAEKAVDVMLAIDTTGSMGDELSYIQSELADVIQQTQSRISQDLSIRTSVNLYRDETDSYVVRSHPFRQDLSKAVADVQSERADGGGDYPEAVDQALSNAITQHQWRDNARAKILFLVLDAPAHDKSQVKQRLRNALAVAADKGIRVVPVAGSGIDKSTEYLLRSMSITTGGTYVFLTDDSGIGGDHIEPTIGSYKVRYLNKLLVDIIARYSESIVRVSSN